jgi:hypothetical protein
LLNPIDLNIVTLLNAKTEQIENPEAKK